MTIDPAGERPLRIIQVKELQPIEPDQPLEGTEGSLVACRRRDVVPGREKMARIEAHAYPAGSLHPVDHVGDLLERRAERRSLPGGMLEQHHRLSSSGEQVDESVGDQIESRGLATRRVAARVKHNPEQTQRFGAIQLVGHRRERLLPERCRCARQIDQIAGVRYDGMEAGRFHLRPEGADL